MRWVPPTMATSRAAIVHRFIRDLAIAIVVGGLSLFFLILFFERVYPSPHNGFVGQLQAGDLYSELLLAAWIVIVGYLLDRAIGTFAQRWVQSQDGRARLAAVSLLIDLVFAAIVVFALFAVFNVNPTALFLGSAFTGIILGLAAQTLLANVFAGITLTFSTPYRVGDRISLISVNYGAMPPSYPHELVYPSYTGTVKDTGLVFTILQLDGGRVAKVPNSVVIQAFIINHADGAGRLQRVRVTLPYSVPVAAFESAVAGLKAEMPAVAGRPELTGQVADLAPSTWDGVVLLWTTEPSEEAVRDRVLRGLLSRLPPLGVVPPAVPAAPPGPPPRGSGKPPAERGARSGA